MLEVIRISTLTDCFTRVGVLAYRSYCGGKLTEWSGWYCSREDGVEGEETGASENITQQALLDFARGLAADAGGDAPEATKTGLAHAYSVMRAEASTLILLYTDAPPHLASVGGKNWGGRRATSSREPFQTRKRENE
jgi:hypothetical protein